MSIEAIIWVRKHAPVENTTEMCILYSLADRANDDGTGCWPSNETIADESRCSPRTVQRHMKELASRGLIVPGDERQVAGYRPDRRPNVWDLNMSLRRDDTGCQNDTPNGSGVTSSAERGDNGGRHGVTASAERGDTVDTQTVLNPPVEPSLNQRGASAPVADATPPTTRKKQAYELPEGWRPDPKVWEQMAKQRPDVDLELEHAKFCDYWPAQPGAKSRKKDWNMTWRNWIRNARATQQATPQNSLAAWGAPSTQQQHPSGPSPFRSIYDEPRAING